MTTPVAQPSDVISFGPFSLIAGERLLMKDGVPVELGARTLDTLVALVAYPNQPVSKADLLARVWPDVIVEEGSLRFHIAALRKALGDGQDGARYIATLAGRGYCFVAPVSRSAGKAVAAAGPEAQFLPARLIRMVGRADGVLNVSDALSASRFVTIVGPGGVGKTTLAVSVAHGLMETFAGAVLFVDLGMLNDPRMVAMSLASMLGLPVQSEDPTQGLIAYLRDKRLLLILDNCEHVIEAAANLTALVFLATSQLHILATSREALRVEGEHVYKLDSLACPPDDPGLTLAAARTFPAAELFMERAAANGAPLDFNDSDAVIVADICRKLDGVPLAIELAAGRVASYGLRQMAALLDQRLALLWEGRRTAPPRQQTLRATLDWSFELLSERERVVLCRLAVFVGAFTLEAALAVVTSATIGQSLVLDAVDKLIAKSMVAVRPVGAMMRYRLLETTRAYLLEIDAGEAERTDLAARHAIYYRGWLEREGATWPFLPGAAERASYLTNLENVRAALEWCFGDGGDVEVGVGLAAAAAPVFLEMTLLTECIGWSERAILDLNDATRGGAEEMRLQATLGVSLMFARGLGDAGRAAIDRSAAIATARGDDLDQILPLGPLHSLHLYSGDCANALQYARRASAAAQTAKDPAAAAVAHYYSGISLHYIGDTINARLEFEAALKPVPMDLPTAGKTYLTHAYRMPANATAARVLWLQGYPAQAFERSRQTVEEAASVDAPVPLAAALNLAATVFVWAGDIQNAKEFNARHASLAGSHWALGLELTLSHGLKGQIAFLEGDAIGGIETLRTCLDTLRAARCGLAINSLSIPLIQAFAAVGRFGEGLELADETIRQVEVGENFVYLPELLRVKGELLLAMPGRAHDEAETCFIQSLELSHGQGALSLELRSATSLTALWRRQGRADRARNLLAPVYGRFTEGFDTADLTKAKRLLDELAAE